jgi:RecG-like helicase
MPIGLLIGHLTGIITSEDYPTILIVFLLFNLFIFLPAIYLHITYFFANSKTLLTIDHYSKRISITEQDETISFSFNDISIVERNLGIYFKNRIDNRARRIATWTNYGYLKLKLKNGKTFYISSLMLDLFNSHLPITQTKYRFIPYLDKQEISIGEKRNLIENYRNEKVRSYIEKFANLSTETLKEKVNNPIKYEPEAVTAAIKILETKSET